MGHLNNMEEKAAVVLGKKEIPKDSEQLNLITLTQAAPVDQLGAAIPMGPTPTSWSTTRGAPGLPFWAWGYVKDTTGSPVPYPTITVKTPTGQPFGGVYRGDGSGAWNMALPSDSYILTISAPGYKSYTYPARAVSNGFKLSMEKLLVVTPPEEILMYQPPQIMMPQVFPSTPTPSSNPAISSVPSVPGTTTQPSEFSAPASLGGPVASPAAVAPAAAPVPYKAPFIDLLFPPPYKPYADPSASASAGSGGGGGGAASDSSVTPALVEQPKMHPKSYFWIVTGCLAITGFIFFKPGTTLASL